jgi:tRNA-specific 2-thiouridylase
MARIVVAMSGGVDSSVVAALLHEQGHDVIGVTLNVWPEGSSSDGASAKACCGNSAVEDARRVAGRLGIPYYVLNFKELFRRRVIDDFVAEYRRGRTPNPCVRCNQHVKFGPVLDRADALGAELVATGHYVRRDIDPVTGRYQLRTATDRSKDQSYVLFPMAQDDLARTIFPLGDLSKSEVRQHAERFGLQVARKPESMGICFVPGSRYGKFIDTVGGSERGGGPVIDVSGRVMGMHAGIERFTVGQRRGLGISSGEALYVVAIDPERNAVVVGTRGDLLAGGLVADALNLVALPGLDGPRRCTARIRHRMDPAPATAMPAPEVGPDAIRVIFDTPQRAVTAGQSVVLYDGDVLLGGATIVKAEPWGADFNPNSPSPDAFFARTSRSGGASYPLLRRTCSAAPLKSSYGGAS